MRWVEALSMVIFTDLIVKIVRSIGEIGSVHCESYRQIVLVTYLIDTDCSYLPSHNTE